MIDAPMIRGVMDDSFTTYFVKVSSRIITKMFNINREI